MCQRVIVRGESHEGAVHMQISTIGIDLAKNVFQVYGVDAAENPVLKKQLRRSQVIEFFGKLPPCLIGMEACATSHQRRTTLGLITSAGLTTAASALAYW